MNYPTRKYLGKTWVGWLNIAILQWIGVRLGGAFEADGETFAHWIAMWPVLPLSGWWGCFIPRHPRTFGGAR